MKVVILFDQAPDGATPDLADNTVQAEEVRGWLTSLGCQVELAAMTADREEDAARLDRLRPDLVFNLVESPGGRGRFIADAPALLDALGLAYTGAGTEAMRSTSNKLAAKRRLRQACLPTPEWFEEEGASLRKADAGRYIIKSVWEHGSVGLEKDSLVPGGDVQRLLEEMERRRPVLGGECFAEEYVEGREFNISLLAGPTGPVVLPPAEILFAGFTAGMTRIVGYRAKWVPTAYEYTHTPRCFDFGPEDRTLLDSLVDLSLACWRLFGLRGWARVDFRVDASGRPMILEVNANPCLSADAGFMAAAARGGLSPADVVSRIVSDASARNGLNRAGNL